jgi:hypothetical protein
MGIDLRLPNITGATEREQLVQIRSYLYQLSSQLQWALNTIDTSTGTNGVVVHQSPQKVVESKRSEDAETTFNSIKALIIKSADIVEAYYEEINRRLTGVYVSWSDYGTYRVETNAAIEANSNNITINYDNLQQVITDIKNLNFTLAEVNAHIKSGLLYYNDSGVPVYGLEIGQKNIVDGEEVFNKYARFTSDRLSFYDQNGTEVAYISDYKLYIRNVEITGSYRIGGLMDTVQSNGDVVTKWVGGNG